MLLVIVGISLVAMKLAQIGPVGVWPWWVVAVPLLGAIAWWRYAEASGLNKRQETKRINERKARRAGAALW